MPAIDGSTVVINAIRLTEQAADPSTPAAGSWKLYVKADGLYLVDDAGSIAGPLGGGIPTHHGVKATRATTQSIPNATWTPVQFTAEEWDTDTYHDNSVNPSRFTVPADRAGYYRLTAHAAWDVSANGDRYYAFRVNGGSQQGTVSGQYRTSIYYNDLTTLEVHLAVGDYAELMVYQDSGGALDVRSAIFSASLMGS